MRQLAAGEDVAIDELAAGRALRLAVGVDHGDAVVQRGPAGFQKAMDAIRFNCATLKEINPLLAEFFSSYEEDLGEIIARKV